MGRIWKEGTETHEQGLVMGLKVLVKSKRSGGGGGRWSEPVKWEDVLRELDEVRSLPVKKLRM